MIIKTNTNKMKRAISILLLCIFAYTIYGQKAIPVDPKVRIGKLDNGLTYYIRHNETPKNRAEFFIAHNVGALQEEDNQDGLAHFLEHLAFNGLKHFPKKSMLEYTEKNGIKFGYDVNAYTSKTHTVYNISNVPLNRESLTDSILLVLHDWSYYILCEPEEIEAERGVIREEWRRGDNSRSRIMDKQNQLTYKGSKYAERTVIGDFDIINNFERQTLIDFYHKWYRPDLQAVIVVGDFDIDKMEAKIKATMSDLPKVENGAKKESFEVPYLEKPLFGIMTDPDISYVVSKLIFKQAYPTKEELSTTSYIKENFLRSIVNEAASQRFRTISKKADINFKSCICVNNRLYTSRLMSMFTITPKKQENVAKAAEDAYREIQRIIQFGISEEEFEYAKNLIYKKMRLSNDVTPLDKSSKKLVERYILNFVEGVPYIDPIQEKELQREVYKNIRYEDIASTIAEMYKDSEKIYSFVMNDNRISELAPKEEDIIKSFTEIENTTLTPYISENIKPVSLKSENLVGCNIVNIKKTAIKGVEQWNLENGVKVVWTHVENNNDKNIDMMIRAINNIGYGYYDNIPEVKIAKSIFERNRSVKGLNTAQYNRATSIYDSRIYMDIHPQYSEIKTNCKTTDFENMLNLIYLNVTDLHLDSKDYDYALSNLKDAIQKELKRGRNIYEFEKERNQKIYNNHPWTEKITIEDCEAMTPEKALNVYSTMFRNLSDFTFYISGTMPKEEVKILVQKYLGSIPQADIKKQIKYEKYQFSDATSPLIYKSQKREIPKSIADLTYFGKVKYNPINYMTLRYLTLILSNKYVKTIREDKGGTYHVGVAGELGTNELNSYTININFETNPKMVEELIAEVKKGIEEIAKDGPSAKELLSTEKYLLKKNHQSKDNRVNSVQYWHNKTMSIIENKISLESDNDEVISSITAKQIQNFAKKMLKNGCFEAVYSEDYINQ